MLLPVTLTIAAAAAIINLWLSLRITRIRITDKVMMGDGGHPLMLPRMRAHANFAENTPLFLVLMALIELGGGSTTWLWVAGAVFVLARLAHPIGMDLPAPNPFRAGGAMVTLIVLGALAVWALVVAYEARPQHRGPVIEVAVPPAA